VAATNGFYQISLTAVDSAGRAATNAAAIFPAAATAPVAWASYYPFTSGAQDASNQFNGTLENGASIVNDPVRGKVLNLIPFASEYVKLPAGAGAAETVSGWVNWDGGNDWQRIFDFGQSTSQFFFLTASDSTSLPQCAITPDAGIYNQVIESPVALPTNQWTHVAVVLDGRQGMLYLNGVAVAVNNSVNLLPSDIGSTNCYFGKSEFSADPYFNGRLSAMRLNSSALSLAQIIAPVPLITEPTNGSLFTGGSLLNFAATAVDYSGAQLSPSAFSWTGQLYSNGLPLAVFGPTVGFTNGSCLVPTNLTATTNLFYLFNLTVTDTNGNQQTAATSVFPLTSVLTLQTVPPGLRLALDGQALNTTTSLVAIAGMGRLLAAPSPQSQSGSNYQFVIWSDGGQDTHSIVVPATNAAFTASFVPPQLGAGSGGGGLNLTWPQWAAAMQLYSATNLTPPASWTPVALTPAVSNGLIQVTVPETSGIVFYRLQAP
ncbi:MAG TPA: LamG domain-containing protein, partial [Candidatus Acidoferrales bacterium]|nr:LamG domain-containing protein [Candidatus Acidoferrales bacterium]